MDEPHLHGGAQNPLLMCDSLDTTMREMTTKGVELAGDVTDEPWGRITAIRLPSGARLGLYEPRHASPLFPDS